MSDEDNKPELIAIGVREARMTQNLSTEVIEYLSKEIETTTTNMMVFRSKIAFAVFVGPFLLLIALATRTNGLAILPHMDLLAIVAIIVVCGCFLTMAYITARIERQAWLQCNKWRGLIAKLHNDPSAKLKPKDLDDNLFKENWKSQATSTYVAAWAVLLTSFIMTIIFITRLQTHESSTPAETTISAPAQKGSVSPEKKD